MNIRYISNNIGVESKKILSGCIIIQRMIEVIYMFMENFVCKGYFTVKPSNGA